MLDFGSCDSCLYRSGMRSWLYFAVGPVLSEIWEHYFDEDVQGLQNVPEHGPLLVASNHISHMDPITLCQVFWKNRPRRQLRFLAKRELFERQPLAWAMCQFGHIPVDRQSASASDSLHSARDALRMGKTVVIFPEGTVSLTFVPMKPHTGVSRLATDTGVAVLPVGLWGTHRTMSKHRDRNIVPHRPVTVNIGEPRRYTTADGSQEEVAAAIMDEVVTLVDRARSRYQDVPGPDDWWGPPKWPLEQAGKWRPRLDAGMTPQEALAEADRALHAEA